MTTRALEEKDKVAVAGSAIGALGAALIAMLASLCCVGPALVAVIGAAGAVAAARLEPYRPYFLAASLAMLGYGFWRSYRPRAGGAGAACKVRTGRTVRAVLWVSLVVTAVSFVVPFVVS